MHHAFLATGRDGEHGSAAQQDEVGPQGQTLENVRAAAKAAVGEDLELVARRRADLRDGLDRRNCAIELAPAMVGHHHAVEPHAYCHLGIRRMQCSLDQQGTLPLVAQEPHEIPIDCPAAGPHRARHGWLEQRRLAAHDEVLQPWHAVFHQRARERRDGPGWMNGTLEQQARGRTQGQTEAAADVVLAVRARGHVGGDHQHFVAGRGGALGPLQRLPAVAVHVALQPARMRRVARDFFHRERRVPGQGERHVHARCRARHLQIRFESKDATDAHGRDTERAVEAMAEQFHRLRAPRHVDGRALAKPDALENRPVVVARLVVFHAPIDVAVQRERQASPG